MIIGDVEEFADGNQSLAYQPMSNMECNLSKLDPEELDPRVEAAFSQFPEHSKYPKDFFSQFLLPPNPVKKPTSNSGS
jgi:hypothetical protein